MQAIQITSPGTIDIIEMQQPLPGPGEVSIRITAAGICGTDLHLYSGLFGDFPVIPGHDLAGLIESVGEGVTPVQIGKRVTIDPAACCTRSAGPGALCAACQRGATNLCEQGSYMGVSAPGGMTEHVIVPNARVVPLPDKVGDDAATVLEPVVVALHLIEKLKDRPGDALIIGGGAIGIAAGLLLQLDGREVIISEPFENRRQLIRRMGIEKAVAPDEIDPFSPMPIIVETSGHPSATATITAHAAAGTTIVLVGGDTTIPGIVILTRELEVRAVKGGCGLYPEAVQLAAEGQIDLKPLISHRFNARDAARAFRQAARKPDLVTRVFLDLTAW